VAINVTLLRNIRPSDEELLMLRWASCSGIPRWPVTGSAYVTVWRTEQRHLLQRNDRQVHTSANRHESVVTRDQPTMRNRECLA